MSFRGASAASEPGIQNNTTAFALGSGFRVRRFAASRNDSDVA
jgi:hypothetical protein